MKIGQISDKQIEITTAAAFLSSICANPSLLLTEVFMREINSPVIILNEDRQKYKEIKIQGSLIKNKVEILIILPNCQ